MKYVQVTNGEWIEPKPQRGHRMMCCDCGLVHVMDFRIKDGRVQFRPKRDRRATAAATTDITQAEGKDEMKPQYEPKTREQFYGYLIEECGEVLHAAGKTLRWGEASVNPEIPPVDRESNLVWLRRELGDLKGAIERMEGWIAAEFD